MARTLLPSPGRRRRLHALSTSRDFRFSVVDLACFRGNQSIRFCLVVVCTLWQNKKQKLQLLSAKARIHVACRRKGEARQQLTVEGTDHQAKRNDTGEAERDLKEAKQAGRNHPRRLPSPVVVPIESCFLSICCHSAAGVAVLPSSCLCARCLCPVYCLPNPFQAIV